MSDGMAFLTGAAFAGVASLFMLKGGTNLGAAKTMSVRVHQLQQFVIQLQLRGKSDE